MDLYHKHEKELLAPPAEQRSKLVALYNKALEPHGYRFIQLDWRFTVIDTETFESLYWAPEEPLWEFDPELFIDSAGRKDDVPRLR
jgi:hypothetical protein